MRVIKLHAPPGETSATPTSGATMLARRLPKVFGGPLRAPHHTVSRNGLLQEAGLAMGGVLYLEESDEFRQADIRALVAYLHQAEKLGANMPTLVVHVVEDRHFEALALLGLAVTIDCKALSATQAIGHFCVLLDMLEEDPNAD